MATKTGAEHTVSSVDPLIEGLASVSLGSVPLPVHVVTKASELPPEFLSPSIDNQLVIGLDTEGVNLSRNGQLCVMQLAFEDAVYLVDVVEGEEGLMAACKGGLESDHLLKVIHDCKRDGEALYYQFGIKLHNVFDTLIAYTLLELEEGRSCTDFISFVNLMADPRYHGVKNMSKDKVRLMLNSDPSFWARRPLTEVMTESAANDVRPLLSMHGRFMERLNAGLVRRLLRLGDMSSRAYCLDAPTTWVPFTNLPGIPAIDEDYLCVVDVPDGKLGIVIGSRGSNIRDISASFKSIIFTGGKAGPPNKVFVLGPKRQAEKAVTKICDSYKRHK